MLTIFRAPRRRAAALVLSVTASTLVLVATPDAFGERSIDRLKDRLDVLQAELDAAATRIEDLRTEEDGLLFAVARLDDRIRALEDERAALEERVAAAAGRIYMTSGTDTIEVLLSAEDFADLAGRTQALAHVSELDRLAFDDLADARRRTQVLRDDAIAKAEALTETRSRMDEEITALQGRFAEVTAEYNELKAKLSARAAAASSSGVFFAADGMACPIAAPNSFIDSWGFPRSGGRTHEGTDMMAEMGAPVVAIIDGRITYAGVGALSGNWLILTGDDGHNYYYMHNRENLVTSGRVRAGEQIATVGDTGNAIGGPPHVHFEYHPNRGGPVNPYPLLARVCRGER